MMTFTPPQKLIYRDYDGFGGFRNGTEYTLVVGKDGGQLCVVHPTSKEPWTLEAEAVFWKNWEKV